MASTISSMKFNLSLKVDEVRVSPELFDALEIAGCIDKNGFLIWEKYPVVIDYDIKDIDFVFSANMEKVESE